MKEQKSNKECRLAVGCSGTMTLTTWPIIATSTIKFIAALPPSLFTTTEGVMQII